MAFDKKSAIVIGAGIVGLATARALAAKGISVKIFERNLRALGASIRNFGMVWPIGQPAGKSYERALRSRDIWKELASQAKFWSDPVGSLQLAYHADEWEVLQELCAAFRQQGRKVELVPAIRVSEKTTAAISKNLFGGLYSSDELIVDPREALGKLAQYYQEHLGIQFYWGKCVSHVCAHSVRVASGEEYEADLVFICSGTDFETLYPERFLEFALTKCKLQMMRLCAQPDGWRIGPALCGGLSLMHYASFQIAPSIFRVRKRFEEQMPDYVRWGIHVMVSQNGRGELTVGDSHEYGFQQDPFDKDYIYQLILEYLKQFAQLKNWNLAETWNGMLPKLTNGGSEIFYSPEPGVYILNGLGSAGMTLSFALAEDLIERI